MPMHHTLISAAELQAVRAERQHPACCSTAGFDLADPRGRRARLRRRPPARARTTCTSTATCPAPRPAATAATRCPTRDGAGRRAGALGHRARRAGGVLRRAGRAPMPRAPGGCCAGWATPRWPCSTAAWPPGRPPAARSAATPRRRRRGRPTRRCRRPMPTLDADELLAQLGQRARARRARRASASAARSSRWTRWPATSPARSTASSRTTCSADGRFKPAAAAARRVRRAAAPTPARAGAPVRLGRHRLPQPAGHGACRPARLGAVPGLVERMVRRPGAAGGARLMHHGARIDEVNAAAPMVNTWDVRHVP